MRAHYEIIADHELGIGTVAVRRIPCSCVGCRHQTMQPWEKDTDPVDQPRYRNGEGCVLANVLGDFNDWKFVSVQEKKKGNRKEDFDELFQGVLEQYDTAMMDGICVGRFGAILVDDDKRHAPDGYYLVCWSSDPYTLQEDTDDYAAGTLVCNGIYWNWLRGATRWFTPPAGEPEEYVFRLRTVVSPDLNMEDLSEEARLPNSWRPARKEKVAAMGPKRVELQSHDEISNEIARRALLDYEDDMQEVEDEDADNSDGEEASIEDNDSGSSSDEDE